MKKHGLFALAIYAGCTWGYAQCTPSPSNIYSFVTNGKRYDIVKENLSWVDASACAYDKGGKLAEINSKAEQDTLFYHVNKAGIVAANTVAPDGGGASYLWLGGNDITTEGTWVWNGDIGADPIPFWQGTSTGNPVGGLYHNWGNEPDNWNNQDGLGFAFTDWPLGLAGQWNDVMRANLLYYIIEYAVATTGITPVESPIFSMYPNPTSGKVEVTIQKGVIDRIELLNILGQVQVQMPVHTSQLSLDVSTLPAGVYYLTIYSGNKSQVQKLVLR